MMRWTVPPDSNELSAADALARKVRRLGAERARAVVLAGDLRHDGRVLSPDEPVTKGWQLELWRIAPDAVSDLVIEPRVIFEGEGLLVLDKPGDLAVHPSARYLHNTLTGWLKRRGTAANPCHRLDRETSGVIVCATDAAVERVRKGAFMERTVDKSYLAVVRGVVRERMTIDAPLALQGERGPVRIRMIIEPLGQQSTTDVEPVCVDEHAQRSIVRCLPRTGRQHQIRAHLAHAGIPIVGDKLYAMGDVWFDAFTRRALSDEQRAALDHPRQALHAERVTFRSDGLTFSSQLPDELSRLVASSSESS